MFSYFATSPQISSTWQAHPSIAQSNPYPPLPPPPQLVHKVWILDCNSCGTFLTNRGMKAVLLLRPNVSLFSTDALPINCSAYTTNPDALRPSPCRPSTQVPSRTCECLTQTLCCHSCGSAVGYMIVIPCSRCTSSISATNRATNGHRFVFHSNEIKASERHYVSGEPGVIPYDVPVPSAAPALTHAYHQSPTHPTTQYNYSHPRNPQALPPQPTSSPPPQSEYLPTPPLELAELTPLSASSSSESLPFSFSRAASPYRSPRALPRSPPPLPPAAQVVPMSIPSQPASASSSPEPRGMPLEQREQTARKLKSGEVLFWHHLSRSGEIPGVQEDSRARVAKRNDGPTFFDR
ncbi:hypothetical protein SERLA73DRAFT_180355 [Serpula lacrymans var. lacrymans S7.3]|uniref:Protein FAM72 n=1 Tax=Serpula lacrymans var. lacrymans (strain S7.3) TaxID=936435 RepID=F8PU60_SERL3|nr:hypothetical protein SERLA73DRAFT_180355 [Serpula lacrymans var. lacrymans S7.3]